MQKVVTNEGNGIVNKSDAGGVSGIQAGKRTERYRYAGWRLVELRDGSAQVLGQFVYGTQYIDEPIRYDRNTDVGTDDDCLDARLVGWWLPRQQTSAATVGAKAA